MPTENTAMKANTVPGNGSGTASPVNPYLDMARRQLPLYEAQKRREAERINDLERRIVRLEALLAVRGIDLDGE